MSNCIINISFFGSGTGPEGHEGRARPSKAPGASSGEVCRENVHLRKELSKLQESSENSTREITFLRQMISARPEGFLKENVRLRDDIERLWAALEESNRVPLKPVGYPEAQLPDKLRSENNDLRNSNAKLSQSMDKVRKENASLRDSRL